MGEESHDKRLLGNDEELRVGQLYEVSSYMPELEIEFRSRFAGYADDWVEGGYSSREAWLEHADMLFENGVTIGPRWGVRIYWLDAPP